MRHDAERRPKATLHIYESSHRKFCELAAALNLTAAQLFAKHVEPAIEKKLLREYARKAKGAA